MNKEHGGAVIEFAIVFPLLLVLLFGIIEFSLMLYDKAMITNASREGARAGIVAKEERMNELGIKGVVDKYLNDHLISFSGGSSPETEVSWAAGYPPKFGDELTVTVTYPYEFLVFPNLSGVTGPIELTAVTVMRME